MGLFGKKRKSRIAEGTFEEQVFRIAQRIEELRNRESIEFYITSLVGSDSRFEFNKNIKILEVLGETDPIVLESLERAKKKRLLLK